MTTLDI